MIDLSRDESADYNYFSHLLLTIFDADHVVRVIVVLSAGSKGQELELYKSSKYLFEE